MTREREEFVAVMTRELPKANTLDVIDLCRKLCRLAATHHRIAETVCSVEMTEAEAARLEKKDDRTEARITELCKPYGIMPVFSGDPRGCTVKLKVPSGNTNDWGGVGVCVPC